MAVVVPDSLLLSFFQEASSALLDDKKMIMSVRDDFLRQLHLEQERQRQQQQTSSTPSPSPSPILSSKSGEHLSASFTFTTTLEICRRKVLDQQRLVLQRVVQRYNNNERSKNDGDGDGDGDGAARGEVSYVQVQERLGGLQQQQQQQQHPKKKLSSELKVAMNHMTECARFALCNMVLYVECYYNYYYSYDEQEQEEQQQSRPSRRQKSYENSSSTSVNKMKLTEYFQLCQTSLKLPRVQQFIRHGRRPLFDNNDFIGKTSEEEEEEAFNTSSESGNNTNSKNHLNNVDGNNSKTIISSPQKRVEVTQRLIAQGMGWDPDFLAQQLVVIFVEKDTTTNTTTGDNNHDDQDDRITSFRNDPELQQLFEQTVAQMEHVIVMASSSSSSSSTFSSSTGKGQDVSTSSSTTSNIKNLNDTSQGGVTRVVSVQYSEIEITPDGRRINVINAAPGTLDGGRGIQRDDDDNEDGNRNVLPGAQDHSGVSDLSSQGTGASGQKLSDEEQKRRIRVASDAAMLQQEILDNLFAMDENQRNMVLSDAADASERFQQELMTLPPGQDRINYLTSISSETSQKLAMHKTWTAAMTQQNGDGSSHP